MEQYLNNLLEQFRLATNSKIDINSKEFLKDFANWLKERQVIGEGYTEFLDYMALRFQDSDCAEIGKGDYDTVVKPYNTRIITPNAVSFEMDRVKNRVVPGNIEVLDRSVVLVRNNKPIYLLSDVISTYMSQNPYSVSEFLNLIDVSNSVGSNIILGVYGSIHDKDKSAKVDELRDLSKRLNYGFISNYETSNDTYYYVVGLKGKQKKLVKSYGGQRSLKR